jgi:hypothetical protein
MRWFLCDQFPRMVFFSVVDSGIQILYIVLQYFRILCLQLHQWQRDLA